MGVPIPTLRSPNVTVAATASLYEAMGFSDLVANSFESLTTTVKALAGSPDRLLQMRHSLRTAMISSVCDAAMLTAQLETRLRDLWRSHCTGEAPSEMIKRSQVNSEVSNDNL